MLTQNKEQVFPDDWAKLPHITISGPSTVTKGKPSSEQVRQRMDSQSCLGLEENNWNKQNKTKNLCILLLRKTRERDTDIKAINNAQYMNFSNFNMHTNPWWGDLIKM